MAEGLTKSERQSYREYVENNPRVARFRARHPDAALNWKQNIYTTLGLLAYFFFFLVPILGWNDDIIKFIG